VRPEALDALREVRPLAGIVAFGVVFRVREVEATPEVVLDIRSALVEDEELAQKAKERGVYFRQRMEKLMSDFPKLFSLVRGKGLLNAVVIRDEESSKTAWNFCVMMMQNGVLAKPTHGNIIRFAPPLVISEVEMAQACDIIEKTTQEFVQAYPQFQ
jgi:acetylornithine/succinyldiaminopimelate/putrescine aminotransferase